VELSSQEILEKMARYVECAKRIRELKDYLLTFRFLGNHEQWLEEELARHDEAVEEVGRLYQEEMLPLIEEMADYLSTHKEDLDKLIEAA